MESYIEHYGYLAVLIGTFLEGETIVVLAGFAAHRAYLSLPLVICAAFTGTLFGDQLFYYIGRKHSQKVLDWRPSWKPRVEKTKQLVQKHQVLIIIGFRFLYGLRTVTPFTLGITGVPRRIFIPLNVLGALIWSVVVGCAGYLFGRTLESLFGRMKHLELWIMLGIILAGVAIWAIRHWRARRKKDDGRQV
jgi:membrane protein DedA with SNARE-associated domain